MVFKNKPDGGNGPGVPAKIEFQVLAPPRKAVRYIFRLNYL
jgi:hypothetical protein